MVQNVPKRLRLVPTGIKELPNMPNIPNTPPDTSTPLKNRTERNTEEATEEQNTEEEQQHSTEPTKPTLLVLLILSCILYKKNALRRDANKSFCFEASLPHLSLSIHLVRGFDVLHRRNRFPFATFDF